MWFCHSARGSLGMVLVRCCYDLQRFAMVLRWLWHGFIIAFLWFWFVFYVCGMLLVFAMVLQWFCYGVNMVLLGCCCGVGDVVLLWL